MQENHNEQPIELTYPVEIQFTDPNETNNSNQPMEHIGISSSDAGTQTVYIL